MEKNSKVLVLGGSGLVGSSIRRELANQGYINVLAPTHAQLDLTIQNKVNDYFQTHTPEYVFMAAAKVGGIQANNNYRADFILQNLTIQNNLFLAALNSSVQKFLFLGSSCIYPKECSQPIKEEYLLTGPLEPTNEPYAIAKIAGLKTAESIRSQYGRMFFSAMPTNLYGVQDNFHRDNSHVIPGLIARLNDAMKKGDTNFEVWGTGKPYREFLYVDDLARACVFLMNCKQELPDWVNIGTGSDISIKDLANLIADVMGFKGKIVFNPKFPDGTMKKLLDVSKIKALGWSPEISLREGIQRTVDFFLDDPS
ncbi:MAG: GDP-fucose synthetase [Bdellovibrionales bacterium GWA2_49_15]|nr:MAG: GDP-fucose synthetase [Bdellovibrionales bacterium GWA2_49_15]HAZ11728.1 GDP-fucose synthetase [Bdellovibrionales bacterium]